MSDCLKVRRAWRWEDIHLGLLDADPKSGFWRRKMKIRKEKKKLGLSLSLRFILQLDVFVMLYSFCQMLIYRDVLRVDADMLDHQYMYIFK